MRLSLTGWQYWAAAVAACGAFTLSLDAAQSRTVKRQRATRAAYQQAAEDAPSVMATPRGAPPAPAAEAAPEAPIPPTSRRSARVVEEEFHEEGLHHEYGYRPAHTRAAHDYGDWDFNEGCLTGNGRPCSAGPVWVRADFILWWRDGLDLPTLVTTAPDGTAQADAGELGQPSTIPLFGGEREEYPVRPGGRVEAGMWMDSCEQFGVGGRFYWLGDAELNYTANSNGSPILAIPFTEGSTGNPAARLIAFPATFAGNLDIGASSEIFGGDAYARMLWCRTDWGRIDVLGGYQYARVNEGLVIDSTVSGGGATNRLTDSFDAMNEFHGGVVGVAARIDHCHYYIDLLAKVGLGSLEETVEIAGQSVTTVGPNVNVLNNSGLFAQPTNVGTYHRSEFAAIPELNANLGWHISDCIDVNFGYTLIVFSSLTRPGDAIDTTVNTTQIGGALAGPARPAFEFVDRDLIVHGLNMGVTFKW